MITTIVLIKADPKRIPEAALKLAGIDGVQEVYSVSGEWDLVAIVKVAEYDQIAQVVTNRRGTSASSSDVRRLSRGVLTRR